MKEKVIIKNVIQNKNVYSKERIVSGPDYRDLGAILLFIFLLPYIVSFFFGNAGREKEMVEKGTDTEGDTVFICNTTAAGTETMPLEAYLINRLPATIDMNYEMETLKAQVVVLRTELMRADYDNATDDRTDESYERWREGNRYIYTQSKMVCMDQEVYKKAKEAVESTKGMYMVYKGYPIKAPYFALSAGATRNGNEVFDSKEYEYLKSVMCERDFTSQHYNKSIKMGRSAFFDRLRKIVPDISAEKYGELNGIIHLKRDRAGYVAEIGIGDKYISGETFRSTYLLDSSCFEISEERDGICIKTKGVGHGLGFCQYGANEAAKKGSDFIDILNYFFSNIVIEKTE